MSIARDAVSHAETYGYCLLSPAEIRLLLPLLSVSDSAMTSALREQMKHAQERHGHYNLGIAMADRLKREIEAETARRIAKRLTA